MKKVISILEQHIRSYKSMVELYEANPHNQAITEHSANEAKSSIIELQAAVAMLNLSETPKTVGQYLHKKTGNVYDVEGEAIDCTNSRDGQLVVIYRSKDGMVFVRDKAEFLEKFSQI